MLGTFISNILKLAENKNDKAAVVAVKTEEKEDKDGGGIEVDMDKFVGDWYEIEAFPQTFENGCSNGKSTYSLAADNYDEGSLIMIDNSYVYKNKEKHTKLTAHVKKHGRGELIVNLGLFLGWSPTANLSIMSVIHVVGHNNNNNNNNKYEYAMVGNSGKTKKDSLWLFSRTPKPLPHGIRQQMLGIAERAGFDLSKLKSIDQSLNMASFS